MVKKKSQESKIINRRARYDYEIIDSLSVGIVLTGAETKALRLGHGQLQGSYVTIKDNELWLVNATINGTSGVFINEDSQSRSRKLLAKRREINSLLSAKQKGLTIIPLEISTAKGFIKVLIATAKGKRSYDKRETIKKRDIKKQIDSLTKQRLA